MWSMMQMTEYDEVRDFGEFDPDAADFLNTMVLSTSALPSTTRVEVFVSPPLPRKP